MTMYLVGGVPILVKLMTQHFKVQKENYFFTLFSHLVKAKNQNQVLLNLQRPLTTNQIIRKIVKPKRTQRRKRGLNVVLNNEIALIASALQ